MCCVTRHLPSVHRTVRPYQVPTSGPASSLFAATPPPTPMLLMSRREWAGCCSTPLPNPHAALAHWTSTGRAATCIPAYGTRRHRLTLAITQNCPGSEKPRARIIPEGSWINPSADAQASDLIYSRISVCRPLSRDASTALYAIMPCLQPSIGYPCQQRRAAASQTGTSVELGSGRQERSRSG